MTNEPAKPIDPVCGMTVARGTRIRAMHGGREQVFCSEKCKARFVAEPDRFVDGAGERRATPGPTSSEVVHTCPMHPQIRRVGPGSCPICGMALEPLDAAQSGGGVSCAELP